MSESSPLSIYLVYSPRSREVIERTLSLPVGSTARQAVEACAVSLTAELALSVWGRKVAPGHVLRDGDRLEVTRALLVDPKVARRERFQKQGVGRAGLFAKRRPGAKAGY